MNRPLTHLIRWMVGQFGGPASPIGPRVNLKNPPLRLDLNTGRHVKDDRRNRRITRTYRFADREISYHATKGWRAVRTAA